MVVQINHEEVERNPPRRHLDKQEAIRHLVHGAIRLIMAKEDPFVIQLVAYSADKLLTDAAKKVGTYLELDWELYVKDEYHKEFFRDYRRTYNYFKHADIDLTQKLPVYDIARLNVMAVHVRGELREALQCLLASRPRIFLVYSAPHAADRETPRSKIGRSISASAGAPRGGYAGGTIRNPILSPAKFRTQSR